MPPAYVRPYVKRQKNDAADAEAICEAVTRANMRFVETKTPEQQSCLMLHRTRHLFIRQQTAVINAIRAHLAEFGIVAPRGAKLEDIDAAERLWAECLNFEPLGRLRNHRNKLVAHLSISDMQSRSIPSCSNSLG
jgi:transposase